MAALLSRLWIPVTLVPLFALGCPQASQSDPAEVSKPAPKRLPASSEDQDPQAREQDDLARWTNPACVELEAAVRERYRPAGKERLEVSWESEPFELPSTWALDVLTGSGHGGGLRFLRFESAGEQIAIEEVVWEGRSILRKEVDGRVRRAHVGADRLGPVLDLVRYLPTVRLDEIAAEVRLDEPRTFSVGRWRSSGDFLALVRVLGPEGEPRLQHSFVGYPSSTDQLKYLPTLVVCAAVRHALSGIDGWIDVPRDELRSCHFVSAFELNQDEMLERSWWWVMQGSVEALGYFGHPGVLPTLELLKSKPRLSARTAAKIEAVLAEPEHWLNGAPKQLVD